MPDLAEYLEFSVEDVLDALETAGAHHCVSLDTPREDADGESGRSPTRSASRIPGSSWSRQACRSRRAAKHLSARERRVLELRFVEDLTQTQIAEMIGVSQMQVSRILRRALSQLRELTEGGEDGP